MNKRAFKPKTFSKAYANSNFEIINSDNFVDFIKSIIYIIINRQINLSHQVFTMMIIVHVKISL